MKKILTLLCVLLLQLLAYQVGAQGIPYSKGRIAISSDGNEHDKDDWAATPFSLALLAARGLQDKLTLYTFSDHVWGSNHDHSDAAQQMRISALEGQVQFGFDNTTFIEAVKTPNAAYAAMTAEINKSTSADPLTIIAAGPMQVVGKAINDANPDKLKHVRIISHSKWNDRHSDNPSSWENHSGWTWTEIENKFKPLGLTADHIVDQNGGDGYDGMRANQSKFGWLKTSPARSKSPYKAGSWQWLYDRQVAAKKGQEFDPSDAGMIIYLLMGKEKTDPSDAKKIMENPTVGDDDDNNTTTCDTKYMSENELVIMEAEKAENLNSQLGSGKWIKKTDVNGYSGTGHLEFTGNNQSSGPAKNPLKYTFTIQKSGFYRLIIRSRKRLDGAESDKSNDCYVRVEGDYGPGPNPGNNHNDDAPLATLKKDTKFFGGSANAWGWAQMLDLGGHDNKRTAIYNFKAGETYTMWISGRSKNYNFDRIVLFHQSDYSLNEAKSTQDVSETLCEGEIVVNQKPLVTITSPGGGMNFFEGEEILIAATASDPDGQISKVSFYDGNALLGSKTTAPYTFNWDGAAVGAHGIKVTALDNEGASTTKSVSITVNEQGRVVLSPIHDAYVQGSNGLNTMDLRVEHNNRVSYLMFDLSSLPGGQVESATLRLTVGSDAGNGTINLYQGLSNNWTEGGINSSSAPTTGALLATSTGALVVGQTYSYQIPAEAIEGNKVSFVLELGAGGNDVSFASKENSSAAAPELSVKVTDVVNASQDLTTPRLSLYPNPGTGQYQLVGTQEHVRWTVMDLTGRVLIEGEGTSLQLQELSSGAYYLRVGDEMIPFVQD